MRTVWTDLVHHLLMTRLHQAKEKAKIFFDVCRLFFDLFDFRYRFGLVWIDPLKLRQQRYFSRLVWMNALVSRSHIASRVNKKRRTAWSSIKCQVWYRYLPH